MKKVARRQLPRMRSPKSHRSKKTTPSQVMRILPRSKNLKTTMMRTLKTSCPRKSGNVKNTNPSQSLTMKWETLARSIESSRRLRIRFSTSMRCSSKSNWQPNSLPQVVSTSQLKTVSKKNSNPTSGLTLSRLVSSTERVRLFSTLISSRLGSKSQLDCPMLVMATI